jgi:hypothetical protein
MADGIDRFGNGLGASGTSTGASACCCAGSSGNGVPLCYGVILKRKRSGFFLLTSGALIDRRTGNGAGRLLFDSGQCVKRCIVCTLVFSVYFFFTYLASLPEVTVSFEAFAKLVRCCGDRYGMNLLADKALESTVALRGTGSGKIGIDLGIDRLRVVVCVICGEKSFGGNNVVTDGAIGFLFTGGLTSRLYGYACCGIVMCTNEKLTAGHCGVVADSLAVIRGHITAEFKISLTRELEVTVFDFVFENDIAFAGFAFVEFNGNGGSGVGNLGNLCAVSCPFAKDITADDSGFAEDSVRSGNGELTGIHVCESIAVNVDFDFESLGQFVIVRLADLHVNVFGNIDFFVEFVVQSMERVSGMVVRLKAVRAEAKYAKSERHHKSQ